MTHIKKYVDCVCTETKQFSHNLFNTYNVEINAKNNTENNTENNAENNAGKIKFITQTYLVFYLNDHDKTSDTQELLSPNDKTKLFDTIKLKYNNQTISTISNKLAHSLLYLGNFKSVYSNIDKMLNSDPVYFPIYFTSNSSPLMLTGQHIEFELNMLNLSNGSRTITPQKIELVYDVVTMNSHFDSNEAFPTNTLPVEIYTYNTIELGLNSNLIDIKPNPNSNPTYNKCQIQCMMWYYTDENNNYVNPIKHIGLNYKKHDSGDKTQSIFISSCDENYYVHNQQFAHCVGEYNNIYMYSFVIGPHDVDHSNRDGILSKNKNDTIRFEQTPSPNVDLVDYKKITQTIFVKSIVDIPICIA